jgi:hypothetical protein
MGTGDVLKVAVPLLGAAEAAAAMGAALRMRVEDRALDPALAERLDAVLDALGVREAFDTLDARDGTALLGIVEGFLAQAADFVAEPDRAGWNHDQASILLAQGHSSALVASALHQLVVPALGDGLQQRLKEPGAAFLDVGAGVAALSIAVCRLWPGLRVVAVDPWQPALALARGLIADADMAERIELRDGVIEGLEDSDGFDLAWLPTFFVSRAALQPAAQRMLTAMRRGGWATFGLYARPGEPFADALADLRTVRQGGALVTPQEVAELLRGAGFSDVGVYSDPAWALPVVFVAGRRS